jgi:23S rRNA (cytidine2498-2'-O)-methyltransferase
MFIVTTSSGFEPEAKREIERIIAGAKVRPLFLKGNLLVKSSEEEQAAIAELREAQTLHLGRVFPVSSKVKIYSSKESLAGLYEQVLLLGKLGKGESFLVRCRRSGSHGFSSRDVETELGSLLEKATGAVVDFENPAKIVVVQIFQNLAFIGVTDAENILVKPIRVFRKYAKGERPFTRAEHKIREAIKAFDLKIGEDYEVLDIGAAPGGWTKVLSSLAQRVVAVDPADLNPDVAASPNVTHLRCKAEEVPADIGRFHLITNDMNIDPSESAKMMVELADHLKEDGAALMTVKFVTRNRKKHVKEAIETLKARYRDFDLKKLHHNRFETTLFMRKI